MTSDKQIKDILKEFERLVIYAHERGLAKLTSSRRINKRAVDQATSALLELVEKAKIEELDKLESDFGVAYQKAVKSNGLESRDTPRTKFHDLIKDRIKQLKEGK